MTPITNNLLNYYCTSLVSFFENSDHELHQILRLYNSTGIRADELFLYNNWIDYSPTHLQLYTAKTGEVRLIDKSKISTWMLERIINKRKDYFHTYNSIYHRLKKYGVNLVFNGNRKISTIHMFRYNYIKQLYEQVQDNVVVKQDLSHINQGTTDYYINAPIYLVH